VAWTLVGDRSFGDWWRLQNAQNPLRDVTVTQSVMRSWNRNRLSVPFCTVASLFRPTQAREWLRCLGLDEPGTVRRTILAKVAVLLRK
jgi:hypothetical protein